MRLPHAPIILAAVCAVGLLCAIAALPWLAPSLFDSDANPRDLPGRWRQPRSTLSPDQQLEIEQLEAIGYVSGSSSPPAQSGVSRHDPTRALAGFNLSTSGGGPHALLMDMEGTPLHRWSLPFTEAFPNASAQDRQANAANHWRRAILLENGDLLVIFGGLGILRIDKHSAVRWARLNRAHHDAVRLDTGDFLTLTRQAHLLPRIHASHPIAEDFVVRLNDQGEETHRYSILEAVERWEGPPFWSTEGNMGGDIFHANGLTVLERDYSEAHPEFTAGRVLVSLGGLHTLVLIDLESNRVVWAMRGSFRGQHDPTMLETGRILVFDNNGPETGSAVFELDPATGDPSWPYTGEVDAPLYSEFCGTAARLANGNTLITESDNGRALEITPDFDIVWQYHNPDRAGPNDQWIGALFEVTRLPADTDLSWLPERPVPTPEPSLPNSQ